MTPLEAVAVPCCGSGTARLKVSGSSSGSTHQPAIGIARVRPWTVSCGMPEFEPQFGAPLVLGSTVNCWVMTALSPPELTPLKLKLSGPAVAGAV